MADSTEQNKDTPKADPRELLLAEAEVLQHDPKKPPRKRTAGEVAFDRVVYTGIGFGVNEASAIVIADEFEHRSGKKLFENLSHWVEKTFKYKDVMKDGKLLTGNAQARNMVLWGSLLISGTLLVYPMKKLEDNKSYWVKKANHWFDKLRGNKVADDFVLHVDGKQLTADQVSHEDIVVARDAEVERALACEPKQTWPSLIIGRGIAVITALGLGAAIGKERSDKMMNWSEKLLTGSVQPNGQKTRVHNWAAVTALETVSCATTSIALEIASKFFAKRGLTVRNPEVCTQIVHEKDRPATNGGGNGSSDKPADKDEKALAQPTAPADCKPTADKLEKFKKQAIIPSESHADQVSKSADPGYSLAP